MAQLPRSNQVTLFSAENYLFYEEMRPEDFQSFLTALKSADRGIKAATSVPNNPGAFIFGARHEPGGGRGPPEGVGMGSGSGYAPPIDAASRNFLYLITALHQNVTPAEKHERSTQILFVLV